MKRPKIVTFSGKARHGKSTAIMLLREMLEGKRVVEMNYADYLKFVCRQYLGWNGDKDEKGRSLLQYVGTEKVRATDPDFWVDTVINMVKVFSSEFDYILIGDCRFPNEVRRWAEEGFEIITTHIERLNFENDLSEEQRNHPSETSMDNFDFSVFIKSSSVDELRAEIKSKVLPALGE